VDARDELPQDRPAQDQPAQDQPAQDQPALDGLAQAIRVLIVEDHPVVAEGLSSLLEAYPEITIAGIAASVADVIPVIERAAADVDVAVVDYHLPDGTAYDAIDRVRSRLPSTAIVLISADDSDDPLRAFIEMGASGYLMKSASAAEILQVIRAAATGETCVPAGILARTMDLYRAGAQERARQEMLASLTSRERQILALMAQGADNRTVAGRLHISYATVRTHVRSILLKLGARSRLEAVAKARESGFSE
jgi:DNA-binding NarL/FixJ family response regulator